MLISAPSARHKERKMLTPLIWHHFIRSHQGYIEHMTDQTRTIVTGITSAMTPISPMIPMYWKAGTPIAFLMQRDANFIFSRLASAYRGRRTGWTWRLSESPFHAFRNKTSVRERDESDFVHRALVIDPDTLSSVLLASKSKNDITNNKCLAISVLEQFIYETFWSTNYNLLTDPGRKDRCYHTQRRLSYVLQIWTAEWEYSPIRKIGRRLWWLRQ